MLTFVKMQFLLPFILWLKSSAHDRQPRRKLFMSQKVGNRCVHKDYTVCQHCDDRFDQIKMSSLTKQDSFQQLFMLLTLNTGWDLAVLFQFQFYTMKSWNMFWYVPLSKNIIHTLKQDCKNIKRLKSPSSVTMYHATNMCYKPQRTHHFYIIKRVSTLGSRNLITRFLYCLPCGNRMDG